MLLEPDILVYTIRGERAMTSDIGPDLPQQVATQINELVTTDPLSAIENFQICRTVNLFRAVIQSLEHGLYSR